MNELSVIKFVAAPVLPACGISEEALATRDEALCAAALIGQVRNGDENNRCVSARKTIRNLLSLFESQRKKAKEPYLEAGRFIDRTVEWAIVDLEKESGRLENLEKDFIRAEMRRKQEEEELQRRELARIEAEKQAELKRIADEQARIEREAREAAAAAARLAAEATNKKQREAAEAAQAAAKLLEDESRIKAAIATAATARAEENASNAAYVESRPVEITRAKGQTVRKKWKITQINDFQLMKSRPDLVRKVEWDRLAINQILNEGGTLPGVTAEEDLSIGTRGGSRPLIDV